MIVQSSQLAMAKTNLPPRRESLLRRPRLVDYLYAHIEKQLFLITAPAGYGKTSLLLDWAHDADFPVAWYALDEFDNAPHSFLAYLIESIRIHFPEFGKPATAALQRASDSLDSLQPIVAMIANELLALPDHLVIVLDDYHVIQNQVIDDLLTLLIRYGGESCHLFINSRTLPRIPDQILLLARGQMDGLSITDLRFTSPEIQALVQQNYNLTVSEPRALELARITDGWITALFLMGHQAGWRELVEDAVTAPEAANRVFDYLAEQIFSRQPEGTREFLLGSSMLDPLAPEILDRLPGLSDSAKYLDHLIAEQLLITRLGGKEELYSYHPLFRDFLRTHLRRDHPSWYEQLALATAKIYAEQEQWERVVEAYLSLGRMADATAAIDRAEESLRITSRIVAMAHWVNALPPEQVQFRPHVLSLRGKIHRSRGELEQAISCFDRAANMFLEQGDIRSAIEKLELKGTALRYIGRYTQCVEESQRIEEIIPQLPVEERTRRRAMSLHLRGTSRFYLGELSKAFEDLSMARELFLKTDDLISLATVFHDLGITCRARGRLAEALDCYSQALNLWDRLQNPSDAANTLNSLGNVYYLKGETEQAEKVLRDALTRARDARLLRVEALILSSLGDLFRDNGDYPQALEFYSDSLRVAQEAHEAFVAFYSRLATGDCYRLVGDFVRAQEWLDSAARSIQAKESSVEICQLKLAQGQLGLAQGQLDTAIALIADALELFQTLGNKHLEALAQFVLAHILHLQGRAEEAKSHLVKTAELVELLGYDYFLVVEGRRTALTLQWASTLNQIGARFKKILEQVHPIPYTALPRVSSQTTPTLSVRTLGQERFTINGVEVTQLRPQNRELFLFLLTRLPHGARKEELENLLWPDLSEERAYANLRVMITRMRKSLCPVDFSNGWYVLDPEQISYDVHEFERGIADAERAQSARARIARLQRAIALYGGDYLERLEADWVLKERARLRNLFLGALVSLAEFYAESGDSKSAFQTFEKACNLEPFLETAWRGKMQTYIQMGNRAAALAQYEKLKLLLKEEFDMEPSQEVELLRKKIVNMTV